MNTSHAPLLSRRPSRRLTRVALSAGLMLVVGGCQGLTDLVTPGKVGALPAQVAFGATIAKSVGTGSDAVTLDVVTHYVKRDKSRARLGSKSLPVSAAAQQAVPIPVDLAVCLADPDREAPAGATGSCNVVLTLALMVNAATVDRQVIGPLTLTPGLTANVEDPVSLFEITAVELSVGSGPILAAGAEVPAILGQSVGLRAAIREREGNLVADRTVTWSSDAPAVASVDERGVVTTIGLGVARITAAIEDVSRTAEVRVTRPPVALSVTAGTSTGNGTIRSTPAGIECRIADGAATGACSVPFAADAVIDLALTPSAGSVAQGWSSECEAGATAGNCRVTMSKARVVGARLAALRRVSVTAGAGDGGGRVIGPAGLDCA
ncbi:MAG: Ig-like domain-containing protein, partial [Cytophagaceae bacterium]|nr:Ig-like domain-containing protein [Gemmatimonadaceae bacterium]